MKYEKWLMTDSTSRKDCLEKIRAVQKKLPPMQAHARPKDLTSALQACIEQARKTHTDKTASHKGDKSQQSR